MKIDISVQNVMNESDAQYHYLSNATDKIFKNRQ